jgi:CxxC motif-containing protein (DUF1111 family)
MSAKQDECIMKSQSIIAALALLFASSLIAAPANENLAEKPGGETTVFATGKNAFSFPAANLTDEERTRFAIGNSFFKRNWVEAPASTKKRDGLGPHFITRSCGGCHVLDGRSAPPDAAKDEQPIGLLMRLSVPGVGEHGGVVPEPVYGGQFNNFAVQQSKPEGKVVIRYQEVKGRFADGTSYTLFQPGYSFRDLGYGSMAKDVMVSPRIAPQLIGVGLLEAIPESEILANADKQKAMKGSIKGMPNQVWDAHAQKMMLGRYGWKANVATIAHQTAGAFNGDIGITSSLFPNEGCTPEQKDCLAAPKGSQGNGSEIDDKTLGDVVFYQATLAPPARRNFNDKQVMHGQKLFEQAQCAVCHRPNYVTAESPNPGLSSKALNGQHIFPYTDLLLHDMGDGLADGRQDFAANGKQWKTPPLWGIGLIKDVNGHNRLLHDGRARGVMEAVLWHGGEAEASRQQVIKMSQREREELVKFVESL